jgi:adenylosuccinate lyase
MAAATGDKSFRDLLAADPHIRKHLNEDQIAALLDPVAYTGCCAQFADEQAARARALAKELQAKA